MIAVQVENEYGGYTVNRGHLETIKKHLENEGLNCLLFTSDGAWKSDEFMFESGSIPSLYATGNFRGFEARDSIAMIRRLRPGLPVTIAEFWDGRSVKYGMDYIAPLGKAGCVSSRRDSGRGRQRQSIHGARRL